MLDISIINDLLKQGKTVKEIRTELNISEKQFQKQIKQLGYKYNQKIKQYEAIQTDYKDNIKVIEDKEADYKSNTEVIKSNDYKDNTMIISKDLDINKVSDLVNEYETLKKLIEWFKDKENTIDRIVIDLPESEDKRTTILINDIVYNQFNEFCNKHGEYSKKDLMAMALLEYINKYN